MYNPILKELRLQEFLEGEASFQFFMWQKSPKVISLYAAIAQLVERILGKDEVTSSTLVISSITLECVSFECFVL